MQRYLKLAQSNRLWLSLGGFQEHCSTDPQRLQNCHVIVDDTGQIVSTYRKVHLFDVEVFDGPVLKETSFTAPGKQVHPTCLTLFCPLSDALGRRSVCVVPRLQWTLMYAAFWGPLQPWKDPLEPQELLPGLIAAV